MRVLTSKVGVAIELAIESRPRCLSIIVELRVMAAGLDLLYPGRHVAVQARSLTGAPISPFGTASRYYSDFTRPMLQPGTTPGPTTKAAPIFETIQIRHNHHVELAGLSDQLHRIVVYDHVVGNAAVLLLCIDIMLPLPLQHLRSFMIEVNIA